MSVGFMTKEAEAEAGYALFEKVASGQPDLLKEAAEELGEFTRFQLREETFMDRAWEPKQVRNEDIVPQMHTDHPVTLHEFEPSSPGAKSVGFATLPDDFYMKADKYPVLYARIMSRRFRKDVDELRSYKMDLRQVVSDNSVKDIHQEKDRKFIRTLNTVMVAPGATVALSGIIQHIQISGDITRDGLEDMKKTMPSTVSRLQPRVVILNCITILDVCKIGFNEMGGGELSLDIFKRGWTMTEFMGMQWIITIKQDLVPDKRFYHLAEPKFMGFHGFFSDLVMHVKTEYFMLEFFCYLLSGATIANTNSVTAADFI
jgi:hypothetical protein